MGLSRTTMKAFVDVRPLSLPQPPSALALTSLSIFLLFLASSLYRIGQRGANVNAQNSFGETPVHGAALKNNYVMIERLIEVGAKVRRWDSFSKNT